MSKDIRSYFFKANEGSTKKNLSEVSSPKGKKRSRRIIESDDDDDDIIAITKKPKETELHRKHKVEKPEIVVQVENFFGSKPVVQKKQNVVPSRPKEEPKKTPSPKKQKGGKRKSRKIESNNVEFENDDELEASLLLTDEEQLVMGSPFSDKLKKHKASNSQKEELNKQIKLDESSNNSKKEISPREKVNVGKTTPKKEEKISLADSEKKKKNAEAYQKYLHRSGPKNPGSKKVPKGTPSCLQGLTFVITGVLDSLEREEAVELIQKCGGRVVSQVSKKTDFVVVGEEPGTSKIEKAEKFGTKKIDEDYLLNLIQQRSEGSDQEKNVIEGTPEKTSKYFDKKENLKRSAEHSERIVEAKTNKSSVKKTEKVESVFKSNTFSEAENISSFSVPKPEGVNSDNLNNSQHSVLWVDKYRPKSTKNIVGQNGEKSNVKKLIKWLQNWHKNHSEKADKKISKPAPWAQNDDGSYYKAALLSGPPGVGKTTSAHLVCEELGFDIIEFNASDTRSKRLLQEVSELSMSKSIRGFFQDTKNVYQKQVLVMDEVDGMAGNEDRGGIQELIQLIKCTKVPIMAICNDRNHPKIRSLVNYCFDLRFQRPRMEQIKGAMKSICFKEKINISGEALEELIISSNHDVRQILHSLSVLASDNKTLSFEETKKKAEQAKKPLNLSPWDVVRKVFSASEHEKMSYIDKTDLFFQDYSLGPLFVQDSYLRVKPYKAKGCEKKKLELISLAADSLAWGDVIEKSIRRQNNWSLLPVQALFSSVLPGHYMSGHIQGQVQFPVWLGKNSKGNKCDRLLQELHSSLRITITGAKGSVNLDYLHYLKDSIVRSLLEGGPKGVEDASKILLEYNLSREDLDSILELSQWLGMKDAFSEVDSKVKAALTRALNKEGKMVSRTLKRPAKTKASNEFGLEDTEEENEDEENDTVDLDPMIKKGKPKKISKKESTNKEKSTGKTSSHKKKEKAKK